MNAATVRAPCPSYTPPTCNVGRLPTRRLCAEHFTLDGAALDVALHGQWMLALRGACDVCGTEYTSADWPIALFRGPPIAMATRQELLMIYPEKRP